ncbi:hypothetical protein [Achromobacter animicus]|uniref:hypothetical protein n=1 Tax=Achromobacter animicus TaxID=1389935 RepID=UPI00244A1D28|nr:hypothetical protein [Achromobacter animicus]MDH0682874.1 hypothetical protein [Achromobacter animicus]
MNIVQSTIHTISALIAFGAFASFVRMLWNFQVEFLEAIAGPWFYPAGAVLHVSGWMLLGLSVVATVKPTSHMVVRTYLLRGWILERRHNDCRVPPGNHS